MSRHIHGEVTSVRRAGTVSFDDSLESRDELRSLSEGADVVTLSAVVERDVEQVPLDERLRSIVSVGVDGSGESELEIRLSSPWGCMVEHVDRDVLVDSERLDLEEGDLVSVRAWELEDGALYLPCEDSSIVRIPRDAERSVDSDLYEPEPIAGRMDLTPFQGPLARLNGLAGNLVRPIRRILS